jgi:peptidoglycan hydrolase-like protein with peptidoglycan-binding domain
MSGSDRNSPFTTPQNSPPTVNPQSTAVALPILREGMRGSAVAQLQERLRTLGFFRGTADGIFGTATQSAVKAAQQNFNLEPDGIVGAATWSALMR